VHSDTEIEQTHNKQQHQLLAMPHAVRAFRRHFDVPQALEELQASPVAMGLEIVGDSEDPS
jgi:hypothetical protein